MKLLNNADRRLAVEGTLNRKRGVNSDLDIVFKVYPRWIDAEYHLVGVWDVLRGYKRAPARRADNSPGTFDDSSCRRGSAVDDMLSLCRFAESTKSVSHDVFAIHGRVGFEAVECGLKRLWYSRGNLSAVIVLAMPKREVDTLGAPVVGHNNSSASDLIKRMSQIIDGRCDEVPKSVWDGVADDLAAIESGFRVYVCGDLTGIAVNVDLAERFDFGYVERDLRQKKGRAFEGFYDIIT